MLAFSENASMQTIATYQFLFNRTDGYRSVDFDTWPEQKRTQPDPALPVHYMHAVCYLSSTGMSFDAIQLVRLSVQFTSQKRSMHPLLTIDPLGPIGSPGGVVFNERVERGPLFTDTRLGTTLIYYVRIDRIYNPMLGDNNLSKLRGWSSGDGTDHRLDVVVLGTQCAAGPMRETPNAGQLGG